jgi:hypothetical protein
MCVDIIFADWAGIAHEVLAVIAERRLNASARCCPISGPSCCAC